jgi:hypothetical protein
MPLASDWRSGSTVEKLMRLDRAQFAVEFLRRNPNYREDYRETQDRIASGALTQASGMEQLARRWSLSFPACTRHACLGVACPMATGAFPLHCHHCPLRRALSRIAQYRT